MTSDPIPLPGMEDKPKMAAGQLQAAIRRTIAALNGQQRLGEKDAARLQLALTMGDVIEAKRASGRMSTIGMDAKVLVDLLEGIVGDADSIDDKLEKALREWDSETRDPQAATRDGSTD